MGTEAHSRASKKRWRKIPKLERAQRMSALSKAAWEKLDEKGRRRRALRAARSRKAKLLINAES